MAAIKNTGGRAARGTRRGRETRAQQNRGKCIVDVPLLRSPRRSRVFDRDLHRRHCFCEDSEAVAWPDFVIDQAMPPRPISK